MKVHLGCRSVRSGHWAVEKVPTQTEMTYDKSKVIKAISKYSFLSEEQKGRILRGYCRVIGPIVYIYIYIYIYWARDPDQGHLVVRGWVNAVMKVRISE